MCHLKIRNIEFKTQIPFSRRRLKQTAIRQTEN